MPRLNKKSKTNSPARLGDLGGGPEASEGRARSPEAVAHVARRGGRGRHLLMFFVLFFEKEEKKCFFFRRSFFSFLTLYFYFTYLKEAARPSRTPAAPPGGPPSGPQREGT